MGILKRSVTRHDLVIAASVAGMAILVALLMRWWTTPPQMGADEEVMKAVDALFTAVRARDEKLLGQCEQQLRACQDAGKLPMTAADYLAGIHQQARAGSWQSAAQRLYDFMKVQRREGRAAAPAKKPNHPGPRAVR